MHMHYISYIKKFKLSKSYSKEVNFEFNISSAETSLDRESSCCLY